MRNELIKKSLICGTIIILLIGASVLPVVNAKEIQSQLSTGEKGDRIRENGICLLTRPYFFVEFNITFCGETFFADIGPGIFPFPDTIYFVGHSNKSVTPPVAFISIRPFGGGNIDITWVHPLKVRSWIITSFNTNLTRIDPSDIRSPDPDGGYVSGYAFFLRLTQFFL